MLDGADCLQITFLLLEFSSCFDQQHKVIRYIYYSTDMSWQEIFHASALGEGKQARQELWKWGRGFYLVPQWVCPKEISRKAWKLRQQCSNSVLQSVGRAYFSSPVPLWWSQVLLWLDHCVLSLALQTQKKGDTRSQHSVYIQCSPFKETKFIGCISEQNKSLDSPHLILNLTSVFRC